MIKYYFFLITFCVHFVSYAQYCQPNEPYDQIVSDFHSTAAKKQDGKWVVWGENKASDGISNVTTPQEINSTNYPGLTGDVLKVALGSDGGLRTQMIILSTTGLYVLGTPNTVITGEIINVNAFTKLTFSGDYGLPTGVNPTDIKTLTATGGSLGILTKSGSIWMLTMEPIMSGSIAIPSYSRTKWSLVHDFNQNPLSNILHFRISKNCCFAVDSNNEYYYWGITSFSGFTNRARVLAKPNIAGFDELPKMIGVTSQSLISVNTIYVSTFIVLLKNGKVYCYGSNEFGLLGQGNTNRYNSWISPKQNPTTELSDIDFISAQEHNSNNTCIAVITKNKKILVWGENDFNMISGTANFYSIPINPFGFDPNTDEAEYLEMGGHTLIYVKGGSNRYCYLGHRINGSMGDGTTTQANVSIADCSNTAQVDLCVFCPKISNNTITSEQHHCLHDPLDRINGSLPTVETTIPNLSIQYKWVKSVNNTTQTIQSNTRNYTPPNLTNTTNYYRLVKTNSTLNCPFDTSNVSTVTIYNLPDKPIVTSDNLTQCNGSNINLTVTNYTSNDPLFWYHGATPINGNNQLVLNNITEQNTGKYVVKLIDQNNCSSPSDTIEITPASVPSLTTLNSAIIYCHGKDFYLSIDSMTGLQYSWKFNNQLLSSTKSVHVFNADSIINSGVYTLTILNKNCPTEQTFNVKVKDCKSTEVIIPEGLSPNNDGINDIFEIKNIENYPNSIISIFNRWGVLVFHATPYLNNWNGSNENNPSLGGSKLPEGTYFYVLTLSDTTLPIKGSFYLKY